MKTVQPIISIHDLAISSIIRTIRIMTICTFDAERNKKGYPMKLKKIMTHDDRSDFSVTLSYLSMRLKTHVIRKV